MTPAGLLDFEQTGLAKDAEMFGHVVLRHTEPFADFADFEGLIDEQADDPDPGVLAECPKRDDAVVPLQVLAGNGPAAAG